MNPTAHEPYLSLLVAAAVGLLVGLERERPVGQGEAGPVHHVAGARTFTLAALAGGVAALLADAYGAWPVVAAVAAVAALAVTARRDEPTAGDRGITTEVALVLTCLVGAWTCARRVPVAAEVRWTTAAAVGVATTGLLSAKPLLRRFASRIVQEDVVATTKFLIVAVVVLPLLPDRDMGPMDAWNPRHIGWMVVLVAAISFVGYVASRLLGRRGLLVTGLVGGLVSSTAVTAAFGSRARKTPALAATLAGGVVAACTVMFPRIAVEAAVVAPALAERLAAAVVAAVVAGAAATWILVRPAARPEQEDGGGAVDLSNPFELGSALWFGALFAGINLAVRAANRFLGEKGAYLAAAVAGLTDVDAVTLSTATLLADGAVDLSRATAMVGIGAASNTLVKVGIAFALGRRGFGARVAAGAGLTLLAGALVLAVS